ncbi:hypothetical protein [Brevibacterium paucivorans]|uniref:Peptidase S9 prolyl oligopeptidase catalytic domain-containing protein n=1 Tax=Brevibacterium paucivorans TaxID=170994 RepID=A0A2N6VRB3_9MICO|nr:hypothetical protein [Brevibacterium paucivorans]PMD06629.1 hypothetical protein CJ199_04565 [Brevibacterium paucivorans]
MEPKVYSGLEEFRRDYDATTERADIRVGGQLISISASVRVGKPLVVVLHGRKSENVRLPYLLGENIVKGIDCSRLSISDPSLWMNSDLSLSWFAGNYMMQNYQEIQADLVEIVAEACDASGILFLGGSGGGFAGIEAAGRITNSRALVWNPQTSIDKYYRRFVDEYKNICWPSGMDYGKRNVTDLIENYGKCGSQADRVYILQNASDEFHLENHMRPLESATKADSRFKYFVGSWGDGHVPPPKDVISKTISLALSRRDDELMKTITSL